MRWARGLVLGLAVLSASGAALLVRKTVAQRQVPAPVARPEPMREVLVMRRGAGAGERVAESDLRWQSWPADAVPAGAVSRAPGAPAAPFAPAIARFPLIAGEPVAEAKLVRQGEGSVIAAMIGAGKRAVAVPVREESAAGGLLQPNDRVDLIWTPQRGDVAGDGPPARTLLRAVKVLAIGRSLQAGGGHERDSRTATLELTPGEARIVAGARVAGELSMALVPLGDQGGGEGEADRGEVPGVVKVLRFGR